MKLLSYLIIWLLHYKLHRIEYIKILKFNFRHTNVWYFKYKKKFRDRVDFYIKAISLKISFVSSKMYFNEKIAWNYFYQY